MSAVNRNIEPGKLSTKYVDCCDSGEEKIPSHKNQIMYGVVINTTASEKTA